MSVTKKPGGALQPAGGPTSGPGSIVQPHSIAEATAVTAVNVAIRRTSPRSISDRRSLVNSRPVSEPRNVTGPAQLPPEAQLSVSAPHRVSMPLVGRESELAQLDGIFARPVEYQAPQLVTVVGTQGTGKTRLVAEWLARLLSRQAAGTAGRPRVYRGRAVAGAGSFALVSRILRDRFGIQES